MELRVIKVGGSLLDLDDFATRIQTWMLQVKPARNVFIIGGGSFCNEVRSLNAQFGFSEEFAHGICIELMSVTAKLLGTLLDLPVFTNLNLSVNRPKSDIVFDCSQWIENKL